jgi:S-adenosylmethionine hydrolase
MPIITLTTDFGTADGYVGALKGVITRFVSAHRMPMLVDIAHDIPPGDIAHAAWVVATSTIEFPHNSIHVVVVDPGVGGARRNVIVRSRSRWFVGPDNGVLAYVADRGAEVYAIENERFHAGHVSPTFHGRDVFARTAAALASGDEPGIAGPRVELVGRLPWGLREPGIGRVVHIDRFGNLITDLPEAEAGTTVSVAGLILNLVRTYEDVESGQVLAYVGSAGTVEVAVRDGHAARRLQLLRGAQVLPAPREAPVGQSPYR